MRVALFARYSSKMQDELSLEAQIHEMQAFVERQQGWQVVRQFTLPETRSSEIEQSPEFQEMIASARRKEFQVLLVHKLDRFGRDRETSVVHKAMLRRLGIQVRSVVENLGDSIMDRCMEGILETMAEWYGANLGQETRKGHRQLTRKGFWTGGKVPFGLQIVDVPEGSAVRKRLAACPVTAPIMVQVFERIANKQPTSVVLDWVAAQTGNRWNPATLYTRIRNPVYYGLIQYGETTMPQGKYRRQGDEVTEARWDGIVSEELWTEANARIQARGRGGRGGGKEGKVAYLLSGLLTCERCGSPVVGGKYDGRPRYVCSGRNKKICTHQSVLADTLEEAVIYEVKSQLRSLNIEAIIRAYNDSLKPELAASESREKSLRKQLREVRQKLANITAAIEQGIIFEDLHVRIKDLKRQESDLAEAIATCQLDTKTAMGINVELVGDWLRDLREQAVDPIKVQLAIRHWYAVACDLVKKEGELQLQLPIPGSDPRVRFCLNRGRSARTTNLASRTSQAYNPTLQRAFVMRRRFRLHQEMCYAHVKGKVVTTTRYEKLPGAGGAP